MTSTNRTRDLLADPANRWYNNPDRLCWDKQKNEKVPGYDDLADIKPLKGYPRNKQIKDLARACYRCPVFRECRIDLLTTTSDWEHYGIQAGMVGQR